MSFILPILAVVIGFLIAYFIKTGKAAIQLLLSFSGALLLSITVFEFLPKVYQSYSKTVGLFIMIGILLQVFLEFLSRGAEHGHMHQDPNQKNFPYLLFISLCIHALIEGYPLHENEHLLFGVVIHKIPVAIIISTFLLKAKLSRTKSILFLVIFALMTPIGSYVNQHFEELKHIEKYIHALVIGIFLHVSTTILFESSKNHQFDFSKTLSIILGICIAYFL
ncbi:ZIP family metal transporter [Haloflavibacter putidus]|uniref:ZIP family metal transporter n=1 Tax=Haloflavibacter putidus TaxID=2576776 RepID=A0A507ZPQ2_9FLAO|nr:ZIP family metal transporter [Haloflavibacter putidus]TQD39289.1 ZIP family metal transporter [Haloflavibacter putidus]